MSSSLVRWKSVQGTRRQCLESIRATLVTNKPLKFDDCIVWARYARKSPPCMRVRARVCVGGLGGLELQNPRTDTDSRRSGRAWHGLVI